MTRAEKEQQWKKQSRKLERATTKSVENQCRTKVQHEDFWSALQHAMQLTRDCGRLYTPYVCQHCGFQHVGSMSNSVVWMFGAESLTVSTENGRAVTR